MRRVSGYQVPMKIESKVEIPVNWKLCPKLGAKVIACQ